MSLGVVKTSTFTYYVFHGTLFNIIILSRILNYLIYATVTYLKPPQEYKDAPSFASKPINIVNDNPPILKLKAHIGYTE